MSIEYKADRGSMDIFIGYDVYLVSFRYDYADTTLGYNKSGIEVLLLSDDMSMSLKDLENLALKKIDEHEDSVRSVE